MMKITGIDYMLSNNWGFTPSSTPLEAMRGLNRKNNDWFYPLPEHELFPLTVKQKQVHTMLCNYLKYLAKENKDVLEGMEVMQVLAEAGDKTYPDFISWDSINTWDNVWTEPNRNGDVYAKDVFIVDEIEEPEPVLFIDNPLIQYPDIDCYIVNP